VDPAHAQSWPLGQEPRLDLDLPARMQALTITRDRYGPPAEAIALEEVPAPRLRPEDATQVLVAVLASGPNFNTNFAALGLPVPVFGRGDAALRHVPGSDAVGIVVDAGAAVRRVRVGQAVVLDSWTGRNIRGYETHDGFNAQLAAVEEERALPVPDRLLGDSPERLAALLLTYGTAYRAVVERLAVAPGQTVLLTGGGKGTSFAGAQIAKALGARVILMGSNPELGKALVARGIADAFLDRRALPAAVFGVVPADADAERWRRATEPFREAVYRANGGRPVDRIFEHTGGLNFPLLVSALAEDGALAFFGATGRGLKGEYKETFFYGGRRLVLDARWVWMRQKQVLFRNAPARAMLSEIRLPPGRTALVWGADAYALEFVEAALERGAKVAVIASRRREAEGIARLAKLGVPAASLVDRDAFTLPEDMPDPLTDAGAPNPAYGPGFMDPARALGKAIWKIFGAGVSPDLVVDRPDQSTLHFSTFLARDFDERDELPSAHVLVRGATNLSILGSHMYRSGQAREVMRLLSAGRLVMEQEDLEVTTLGGLPAIQQKMLEGRMTKPKGVALVQASRPGRPLVEYEAAYLGRRLCASDPAAGRLVAVHENQGVGIVTLDRPDALNALNEALLAQLEAVIAEVEARRSVEGVPVRALVLRGSGRAFMAGADIAGFAGATAEAIAALASRVIGVYGRLEALPLPVVALVDGFALGGGNELAMSAHHRIVTENAAMGQPEVKLGIVPGYGGMQRLPRLVGPRRALALVANGEAVDGHAAVELGLADAFCPAATALREAFRAARAMADGERPIPRRRWDDLAAARRDELAALLAAPAIADLARSPAPAAAAAGDLVAARRYAASIALEALRAGFERGFAAGLGNDARLFGAVTASPSGQHWVGRFLAKDPRQSSFLTLLPEG
jgi:enoyl-CoA hydratase